MNCAPCHLRNKSNNKFPRPKNLTYLQDFDHFDAVQGNQTHPALKLSKFHGIDSLKDPPTALVLVVLLHFHDKTDHRHRDHLDHDHYRFVVVRLARELSRTDPLILCVEL